MTGWADQAKLERDLAVAAERTLQNFYKQAGGDDEREHPTLARAIRAIVGEQQWRARPNQSLLDVMWDAIVALPDEIAPQEWQRTSPPVPARGKPEQVLAAILYGYNNDELPPRYHEGGDAVETRTYDGDYRPAALRFDGLEELSERGQRRTIEVIRQDLAHTLLKMESRAVSARGQARARAEAAATAAPADDETSAGSASLIQGADATAPQFTTPYISRDQLFIDFMDAWLTEDAVDLIENPAEGAWPLIERICLIGEAGTGKTRFLHHALTDIHPIWINAEDDATMVPTMLDVLTDWVQDTPRYAEASIVKRDFRRLLAHPEGPPVVIFDNVSHPDKLDQLVPSKSYTRILVTCRKRPPEDWAPVIEVKGMEHDDAMSLIAQLLPESSVDDRRSLAWATDHRPLLIEHACTFLRQSGVTIPEFCTVFSQDATNTLDGIADTTDRKLTAIYRLYKDDLAENFPESLRLLELLPFVAHLYVPQEYLMAYLLGVPYIRKDQLPRAEMAFKVAIQPLKSYSLVDVHEAFGVSMRPFVQHVLRRVFAGRFMGVLAATDKMFGVSSEDLFAEGWNVLTVAGRDTCNRVLYTHMKDQFIDSGRLTQDGTIGSMKWTWTIAHLWVRHFKFEYIRHIADGSIPLKHGEADADWARFLVEDAEGLPELQQRERFGVFVTALSIMKPAEEPDTTTDEPEPMSDSDFQEKILEVVLRLTNRYEDSEIGPLDLSLLNTYAFDPEQQDELRTRFREVMRAAHADEKT